MHYVLVAVLRDTICNLFILAIHLLLTLNTILKQNVIIQTEQVIHAEKL